VADLYPTKTRLALLAGIDAGEVMGYPVYDSGEVEYYWQRRAGFGDGDVTKRVSARVEELLRQDPPWVERGEARGSSPTADFVVALTEVGRRVLEDHGG
jgi:hypothetical protein